jgi:hypothetical protein
MRMDEYMHMDNNPVKEFTIVQDVTSEEELCHGKDVKLVAISLRLPPWKLLPFPMDLSSAAVDSTRQYLQLQGNCLL